MATNSNVDGEVHPSLPPSRIPHYWPGNSEPGQASALAGQGTYGIVYKVPVGNGVIAARKVFELGRAKTANTHPCMREFLLLKQARDEGAANVVHLLPPPHKQVPLFLGDRVDPEEPVTNSKGQISFDMQFATFGNMREFIQNNPQTRVTEGFVAWVGRQAFAGLAWLHRRNILHGDIKPENLLVWAGPTMPFVKLGDLGSAVPLDNMGKDEKGLIKFCITTHPYSAPEMIMAGVECPEPLPITRRTDVYSLGSVIMEFTGTQHPTYPSPFAPTHLPHPDRMRFLLAQRPHELVVYNPRFNVSANLQDLFDIATAWDPLKRMEANTLRVHPAFHSVRDGHRLEHWVPDTDLVRMNQRRQKSDAQVVLLKAQLATSRTDATTLRQELTFTRECDSHTGQLRVTLPERVDLNPARGPRWESGIPFSADPTANLVRIEHGDVYNLLSYICLSYI